MFVKPCCFNKTDILRLSNHIASTQPFARLSNHTASIQLYSTFVKPHCFSTTIFHFVKQHWFSTTIFHVCQAMLLQYKYIPRLSSHSASIQLYSTFVKTHSFSRTDILRLSSHAASINLIFYVCQAMLLQ